MHRDSLIKKTAVIIAQHNAPHPLRVAVDGVDAAGKTLFADELASALTITHRQVIRASVDGFHLPKTTRWQKGPLSPEGFYRDSYNYPGLIENLLLPLSPKGSRRYRTAVFDVHNDCTLQTPWQAAEDNAILIIDGIFLLRPILLPYWDISIFLKADFENTVGRGVARDRVHYETQQDILQRYDQRYVPGQEIYLNEARPLDKADILIDNNILDDPEFLHLSVRTQSNSHRKAQDRPGGRKP